MTDNNTDFTVTESNPSAADNNKCTGNVVPFLLGVVPIERFTPDSLMPRLTINSCKLVLFFRTELQYGSLFSSHEHVLVFILKEINLSPQSGNISNHLS